MKKLAFLMVLALSGGAIMAQSGSATQVHWNYSAKKIGDKTYEVHMVASIGGGWHMYSQKAGEGPVPTSFTYTKSPLITLDGETKEVGKMKTVHEAAFNSDVHYYENTVEFVQVVKLKSNAKTNIAGKVEFMVCNDHECLPPTDVDFKVAIGG